MKKENNGIYLFIVIIFIIIFSFWVRRGTTNKSKYEVESISFINGPILMKTDETYKTNIMFNPIKGSEKVTYYIENTDIASVDKYGNVTAKSVGSTYLVATLKNGIQDNVTVVVNNSSNTKDLEKLSIDEFNIKLKIGEKHQIKYTIIPSSYTNNVTWYSSNPNIVSVDKGIITANEIGTSVITAYYNNQFYDSINVTVESNYVELDYIKIDKASLNLNVGSNFTLKLSYYPNNASNQNVTWSSSNNSVASVDNGLVIAKKKGTAIIKAKVGDKEATSTIIVSEVPETNNIISVQSVKLNKDSVTLDIGSKEIIEATVMPSNASNKTLKWISSNDKVFKISNNTIEAIGEGEAILSVTSDNGKAAYLNVKVNKKIVESSEIKLDLETIYLHLNQTINLNYTIMPTDTTNKNVTWYSGSDEIVSVDNGVIKGLKYGKTTIGVLTSNGKTDKVTVYVIPDNSEFKYGEVLSGTNNYCLYGGYNYNRKINISKINKTLNNYINSSKEISYIFNDVNDKRVMVASSAYFLVNNEICKIKYTNSYYDYYITKGWYKGWTSYDGIDLFALIKWSYYQVFEDSYNSEILGKYISSYNRRGLYLKDILDKAKIGDVLINRQEKYTEFALIINVDKDNKKITIINDKNDKFDIVTIGYNNYTGYNTLTNMDSIFKE